VLKVEIVNVTGAKAGIAYQPELAARLAVT
jgi:hypothetical protein